MAEDEVDTLRARLEEYVGKPMGPPAVAPDAVNVPMIRHWVDALDDRTPVYLDEEFASTTRFGGIVAPPAMLQTWTMARPRIEGIAERGGAPNERELRCDGFQPCRFPLRSFRSGRRPSPWPLTLRNAFGSTRWRTPR